MEEQLRELLVDCQPNIKRLSTLMNKKVTCPMKDGMVAKLE